MRGFNEGKACDAVINRIEAREGQTRGELRFPEQEHHTAPVELVCQIGRQLFALEHTSIEPFEQHKKLEVKAPAHFQPIQKRLAGFLPPEEHFELQVPAKATLGLRPQEIRGRASGPRTREPPHSQRREPHFPVSGLQIRHTVAAAQPCGQLCTPLHDVTCAKATSWCTDLPVN
jgi:hypothetical protein